MTSLPGGTRAVGEGCRVNVTQGFVHWLGSAVSAGGLVVPGVRLCPGRVWTPRRPPVTDQSGTISDQHGASLSARWPPSYDSDRVFRADRAHRRTGFAIDLLRARLNGTLRREPLRAATELDPCFLARGAGVAVEHLNHVPAR
jgi:hypothetical protein